MILLHFPGRLKTELQIEDQPAFAKETEGEKKEKPNPGN